MKNHVMALLAGLMLAAPVMAQDANAVGGSIFMGSGDLKKVTNSNLGLGLHFSRYGVVPGAAVSFRAGVGYNMMPGKSENGVKVSLTSGQVFGDVFANMPIDNLRLVTGLSLNQYWAKADTSLGEVADGKVKGLKMGLRAGFEYTFSERLTGEVLFQATELGTSDNGGLNPSWLQFGVRFHF